MSENENQETYSEEQKRQADSFGALAKSAWDRFNSRRDMELKTSIGIWTVFGAGSFGVFNSNATLPWWAIPIAILVSSLICAAYWFWLQYTIEAMRRDALTSYYWELQIQKVSATNLCGLLDPKYGFASQSPLWDIVAKEVHNNTAAEPTEENRQMLRAWHTSQCWQLGMAIVFGVFFVGAVVCKVDKPEWCQTRIWSLGMLLGVCALICIVKWRIREPVVPVGGKFETDVVTREKAE